MKEQGFSVGVAMRKACIDAGLRHKELADMIGVSPRYMVRLMAADHVNTRQLVAVCDALEIKPSNLIEVADRR